MEKTILKGINDLISLVSDFNELLKTKYKIQENLYDSVGQLFPKEGIIINEKDTYKYRFHGGGCSLEKGIMKLQYSLVSLYTSNETIKINPGDFMQFLNSYSKEESIQNLKLENFFVFFKQLEKEGILIKTPESIAMYEINETALNRN